MFEVRRASGDKRIFSWQVLLDGGRDADNFAIFSVLGPPVELK